MVNESVKGRKCFSLPRTQARTREKKSIWKEKKSNMNEEFFGTEIFPSLLGRKRFFYENLGFFSSCVIQHSKVKVLRERKIDFSTRNFMSL
jgi:hypothetical protein